MPAIYSLPASGMVRSRSPKFRPEKSSWDVSRTRSQWHEQATESDRSSRESSPDTSPRSKSGPSTALNISARGGPSNTDGSRGRARHRSQIVGVPLVTKSIGHGRQVLVPDESGAFSLFHCYGRGCLSMLGRWFHRAWRVIQYLTATRF